MLIFVNRPKIYLAVAKFCCTKIQLYDTRLSIRWPNYYIPRMYYTVFSLEKQKTDKHDKIFHQNLSIRLFLICSYFAMSPKSQPGLFKNIFSLIFFIKIGLKRFLSVAQNRSKKLLCTKCILYWNRRQGPTFFGQQHGRKV